MFDMENFSSYWKEVTVILAAAFAITGALFEVRDCRTKKITTYGRLFFLLTALTMIGGFYAQWLDNADEAKRNADQQAKILRLINNTDKAVADMSRLLQPIETLDITASFELDCDEKVLTAFCDTNIANLEQARHEHYNFDWTTHGVDWSNWPKSNVTNELVLPELDILFARNFTGFSDDPNNIEWLFADRTRLVQWDMMVSRIRVKETATDPKDGSAHLWHDPTSLAVSNNLLLVAKWHNIRPDIATDKMLSVVDLPGSTLVACDYRLSYPPVKLIGLLLTTSRGRLFGINNFQVTKVKGPCGQAYVYHFSPMHTGKTIPDK